MPFATARGDNEKALGKGPGKRPWEKALNAASLLPRDAGLEGGIALSPGAVLKRPGSLGPQTLAGWPVYNAATARKGRP